MTLLLWLVAVVLVVARIVAITRGQTLWGIVLIVVGLLVGPGGVSVFDDDNDEDLAPVRVVAEIGVSGRGL